MRNCGQVVVDPSEATTLVQLPPSSTPDPHAQPDKTWSTIETIIHPVVQDQVVIEPSENETYWHDV